MLIVPMYLHGTLIPFFLPTTTTNWDFNNILVTFFSFLGRAGEGTLFQKMFSQKNDKKKKQALENIEFRGRIALSFESFLIVV